MGFKRCEIPCNTEWPILEKVHGKKGHCCFGLTEKLHLIEYFDDIQLLIKQKK